MALIADSGAIYALYDSGDQHHRAVVAALDAEPGPLIIPAAILAEIDYLLRIRLGVEAELQFLDGIRVGAYFVESPVAQDIDRSAALLRQYRDLDLGFADAVVIATAERLGIRRILTVDERDFRAVRTAGGKPFTLLPADS
jgi:predicted nucleic acid-binding protein